MNQLIDPDELIVDLFAGGGGMSEAIWQALGRHPDYAVNHDEDACDMHRANHPQTRHFKTDVFEVAPMSVTHGRRLGLLHLSPDCTHFSQAKGGQKRDAKIRGLSWVGLRWAGQVRPRVITLENVKQIRDWGPLIAKRDEATGRVVKIDGCVAAIGERVPVRQQFLIPDPKKKGRTWRRFQAMLRAEGYMIEDRVLCVADFGAPTTRERLFMVARRDGEPINWPAPSYYKTPKPGEKRWRAAAECIDWSLPCPSIFDRARPLAEASLRRTARGLKRYVIDSPEPYIVNSQTNNWPHPVSEAIVAAHLQHATHGGRARDIKKPAATITTAHRGEQQIVAATLIQTGYGERIGQAPRSLNVRAPLGTVVAGAAKHAAVAAFIERANGGPSGYQPRCLSPREPAPTITGGGPQRVAEVQLADASADLEYSLSPRQEAGALRVAAFLIRYYGEGGQWGDLRDPAATLTTKDRLALVTVWIKGHPYVIVDIGLRMLTPRELYTAQGFGRHYIIDRGASGKRFSKSTQVRMVGNSVSPPPAVALLRSLFRQRQRDVQQRRRVNTKAAA